MCHDAVRAFVVLAYPYLSRSQKTCTASTNHTPGRSMRLFQWLWQLFQSNRTPGRMLQPPLQALAVLTRFVGWSTSSRTAISFATHCGIIVDLWLICLCDGGVSGIGKQRVDITAGGNVDGGRMRVRCGIVFLVRRYWRLLLAPKIPSTSASSYLSRHLLYKNHPLSATTCPN